MASTHKSFTQHFKNRMTKENTCKTVKEFFEKSLIYLYFLLLVKYIIMMILK